MSVLGVKGSGWLCKFPRLINHNIVTLNIFGQCTKKCSGRVSPRYNNWLFWNKIKYQSIKVSTEQQQQQKKKQILHSYTVPCHQLLRNLQKYSISHSCDLYRFSSTFLCCNPTTSMYWKEMKEIYFIQVPKRNFHGILPLTANALTLHTQNWPWQINSLV